MSEGRPDQGPGQQAAPRAAETGIVSVNSRGGSNNGVMMKIVFALVVLIVIVIGALITMNKWRAHSKEADANAEARAKAQNNAAAVHRRLFDTDPPPLPGGAASAPPPPGGVIPLAGAASCADKSPGVPVTGPDGKPLAAANGVPLRVCPDGRLLVPAVEGQGTQPVAGARGTANGAVPVSRYTGDVAVAAQSSMLGGSKTGGADQASVAATGMSVLQSILGDRIGASQPAGQASMGAAAAAAKQQEMLAAVGSSAKGGSSGGAAGSFGSLLGPSETPMARAGLLGDRNMILPKGRTIPCALSIRLINEVSGQASCVLSQDVYSDNGKVVLLERGSEATGEYGAAMAQGQRRLFVLWTRVKTPTGVKIELNSPAADALGTTGMDGYVDNHWWERIGAAFLLSTVQDAIGYETAKASNGQAGVAVLQNTAQTGNTMSAKVLESTINIKPTLYKNQGDRGSIYVARDLDFGSVYELRAR